MIGEWTKWEPIKGLSKKYYIDCVVNCIEGFVVTLSDSHDKQKKVKVSFTDSVDAYRETDESYRLQLINELDIKYGVDFFGDWTFFKVTDSQYLKWLSEESYTISESHGFVHFSFIAMDSVLDIVTNYEPKVELIESI